MWDVWFGRDANYFNIKSTPNDSYSSIDVDCLRRLILYSAITPKSEDKYVVKVFNWSEAHLSEMTCYKIHTLVVPTEQFADVFQLSKV